MTTQSEDVLEVQSLGFEFKVLGGKLSQLYTKRSDKIPSVLRA